MQNPLQDDYTLPPFSAIKPEHVEIALDDALDAAKKKVATITANLDAPDWQSLIVPMEELDASIDKVWSPVSHLNSVMNSDELRAAYNACLPKLSQFGTELGQNEDLFKAYKKLADSPVYAELDTAQKKVIDNAIRDFQLSGVELSEADREEFKNVSKSLTELTAKFEENLLDATHAWKKHITDEALLAGLPPSTIAMAKQFAEREQLEGWLFTLDFPSYMPVMSYADNREFREEMYRAFCTKASDQGPNAGKWDNTQVMADILKLRHKLAELIGFNSHAERSLAIKMAQDPQ
jgi:oligopeptidase A